MSNSVERVFKRDMAELTRLFEFVSGFADKHNLDEAIQFPLNLAVEEIFTNMVKYSQSENMNIPVHISLSEGRVVIKLIDTGAAKFDLTIQAPEGLDAPLQDKKVGGLGLHLVKTMMDGVEYEYTEKGNEITIIKNTET